MLTFFFKRPGPHCLVAADAVDLLLLVADFFDQRLDSELFLYDVLHDFVFKTPAESSRSANVKTPSE